MVSFCVSVLASVTGGALLLVAAAMLSRTARWVLIGALSRLLDVDIDYVFSDKKECENDLKSEVQQARWLCFMAGRGNELQRDAFSSVFAKQSPRRLQRTRILLPQTRVASDEYDWLKQREGELAAFDTAYGDGLLATQVTSNLSFLVSHLKRGRVEVRTYNSPNLGRIILTDRCAYYTPYRKDSHGRHSHVYKFRRHCEMYENYLRLFEQLWTAGTELEVQGEATHDERPTAPAVPVC